MARAKGADFALQFRAFLEPAWSPITKNPNELEQERLLANQQGEQKNKQNCHAEQS